MLMLYGYVWWNKKKHILRYWHNIYNNPQQGLVTILFHEALKKLLFLLNNTLFSDYFQIGWYTNGADARKSTLPYERLIRK